MLKILKEMPKEIPAGQQMVSFNRKSTKDNPVAEADKFRCTLVPAFVYGIETTVPPEAKEVFAAALEEIINETAGEILKAYCIANPSSEEISEDSLTFAAILQKMQESATGERLNGEQITAWYDASQTKKDAEQRYGNEEKGKRQQAALRSKYASLASNNPGIEPKLAEKMLGYISADDVNNAVCRAVCKKLERLQKVQVSSDEL